MTTAPGPWMEACLSNSAILALREEVEPRIMDAVGQTFARTSWAQCRLMGAWLGLLVYAALGKRRQVSINNIRLAFPGMGQARANQLARRTCINFGMTFAEFSHLRSASAAEIREYCTILDQHHLDEGLSHGKGIILSTAHLGNWEVMGARAAQDYPLAVVARPSSNQGVQANIEESRAAAGIQVISKYDTGRASLQVLRGNGCLGILPDQHAGASGLLLPMFGQPTRFIGAVARLAMMSGATVVPAYGVRRKPWLADGRIMATTLPGWTVPNVKGEDARAAAIEEGTRRVIAELEGAIRANPDQWLWLHRRWRTADGAVLPS